MRHAFLFLGLISASCLPAQQTSLTGPVEALTFDAPTRSLHAVFGIPGAASYGPALLDNLDFASVAPRQKYGIVFEGGKCLLVSGLDSQRISTKIIAGVTTFPQAIVWSGDGSSAILYSRTGAWFQTIKGFPGAPLAGVRVDVSSLGGLFTTVAVDTSGQQIALAVSGDNGGVYQAPDGQFIRLASMAKPVSLSFSADGQTLYALDAGALHVIAVSLGGNGFQTLSLPGITNPIAIQSLADSQNRQVLYVAGGADRMLRILDVASQQIVADIALSFEPTGVDPFGNGSFVLAFRSQSANPLWLFSSTPQPVAYFVPAIHSRQPEHRTAAIAGGTR
jgi:WD40 repeat protein